MRRADEAEVTEYIGLLQRCFGDALRRARVEAGLTQSGMAAVSGITRDRISAVECGHANSTIRVMARLALGVGQDVGSMLARTSEE